MQFFIWASVLTLCCCGRLVVATPASGLRSSANAGGVLPENGRFFEVPEQQNAGANDTGIHSHSPLAFLGNPPIAIVSTVVTQTVRMPTYVVAYPSTPPIFLRQHRNPSFGDNRRSSSPPTTPVLKPSISQNSTPPRNETPPENAAKQNKTAGIEVQAVAVIANSTDRYSTPIVAEDHFDASNINPSSSEVTTAANSALLRGRNTPFATKLFGVPGRLPTAAVESGTEGRFNREEFSRRPYVEEGFPPGVMMEMVDVPRRAFHNVQQHPDSSTEEALTMQPEEILSAAPQNRQIVTFPLRRLYPVMIPMARRRQLQPTSRRAPSTSRLEQFPAPALFNPHDCSIHQSIYGGYSACIAPGLGYSYAVDPVRNSFAQTNPISISSAARSFDLNNGWG